MDDKPIASDDEDAAMLRWLIDKFPGQLLALAWACLEACEEGEDPRAALRIAMRHDKAD